MDCERFQMDIEKRRLDALTPEEALALDAHLDRCARCREYGLAAHNMEKQMTETFGPTLEGMDWDRVRAGFLRMQTRQRRRWAAVGVGYVVLAAALWLLAPREGAIASLVTLAAMAPLFVLAASRAQRPLR